MVFMFNFFSGSLCLVLVFMMHLVPFASCWFVMPHLGFRDKFVFSFALVCNVCFQFHGKLGLFSMLCFVISH